MSIDNPYAAPEADMTNDTYAEENELATRGQRFGAVFIDGLIAMTWVIPLVFAFGVFDYQKRGQMPPFSLILLEKATSFLIFVLVQGYFLRTKGQTIGKKLVGIRIATLDGGLPPFGKLAGLRYLPIYLISTIPIIGPFIGLVDCCFIFRSDKRCVHDLIAGTRVLKA